LRAEFYEHLNRTIGYLKQRRINQLEIKQDELTGDPLHLKSCEFSHIRSVSLFPELAGLSKGSVKPPLSSGGYKLHSQSEY